jgi:hypothetical protein
MEVVPQTFAIRYGALRPLLSVLGLGPAFSRVDVGDSEVRVVMGWGFRARIPRSAVTGASESRDARGGIGVHWAGRGTWLVNGATSGIVDITVEPRQRALMMFVPVRVSKVLVSVEDPAGLVMALQR